MKHDEMIAVIQHHKDGGEIEYRLKAHVTWKYASCPWWDFDKFDYRAKPEPMVIYAEVLHGHVARYALRETKPCMGGVIKKFVEVEE